MKLYKICNKISLLLHVLASAAKSKTINIRQHNIKWTKITHFILSVMQMEAII